MLTHGRSIDPSTGPPGSNKEVITASRTADPWIASCQFREVGSKDFGLGTIRADRVA